MLHVRGRADPNTLLLLLLARQIQPSFEPLDGELLSHRRPTSVAGAHKHEVHIIAIGPLYARGLASLRQRVIYANPSFWVLQHYRFLVFFWFYDAITSTKATAKPDPTGSAETQRHSLKCGDKTVYLQRHTAMLSYFWNCMTLALGNGPTNELWFWCFVDASRSV